MKRIYLFLACLFLGINAYAFPVTLIIDDSANAEHSSILFKGQFSEWANVQAYDDGTNGDATAGDNIWSLAIDVEPGTYEWGGVNQNDNWLINGPNPSFTVDADGNVEGTTTYVIPLAGAPTTLLLTVVDGKGDIEAISFKGSYGSWQAAPAYDDGTNGDVTAGDNIWSLEVTADAGASYEWGAERTDCASPAWIIQGGNPSFEVSADQIVSGTTEYVIEAPSDVYDVTFRVDMSDQIVSGDGVVISGNFESCPWSKQDVSLEDGGSGIYSVTYQMAPGVYEYKYFNGLTGDEVGEGNVGGVDPLIFAIDSCGVENGLGGSNRLLDLSDLDGDLVLDIVKFNSCETVVSSVKDIVVDRNIKLNPNPTQGFTQLSFDNLDSKAHTISLTDMTGKVLRTYPNITASDFSFDVSDLKKGMYLLSIQDAEGYLDVEKLIIQ